jgi:Na+-driven multidrug efflux pump
VPLSYVLALGIGDWPGLGMAGPAISSLLTSLVSALLQARALWRGKLGFVPAAAGVRLQGRLFWDILRVGLIASFSAFTANLTAMLVTGLVGRFGVAALAGYGIGVRLEFMLVPLAFGIGSGLTTLVGVAAGANDWKRAVRAAWIGSLTAAGALGVCGWILAFVPEGWARLFTSDPKVVEATVAYITRVAPFYCLFGLALTLYFASQGAGRMTVPVVAGVVRMVATVLAGWLAVETFDLGLEGVFAAIAVGMAVYGGLMGGLLLVMPWRARRLR